MCTYLPIQHVCDANAYERLHDRGLLVTKPIMFVVWGCFKYVLSITWNRLSDEIAVGMQSQNKGFL